MYNHTVLIGNLTKDVEVKYTPGGTAAATIGIAVSSKHKKGDEVKEETLFIDCIVFGKQAESCGQYLAKGKRVLVEGRLRQRRWEYEGQKKSKMEVVASLVRFLSPKDSDAPAPDAPPDEVSDKEPF